MNPDPDSPAQQPTHQPGMESTNQFSDFSSPTQPLNPPLHQTTPPMAHPPLPPLPPAIPQPESIASSFIPATNTLPTTYQPASPTTPSGINPTLPPHELPFIVGDQNVPPAPTVHKAGKSKLLFIIIAIFLVLILVGGGTTYALAYEKISVNNPELEKSVRSAVLSLPFMPKTPRYIIEQATTAQKRVKTNSFDLSFALKSDSLVSLGLGNIDAQITGDSDISNIDNPLFNLKANITKDFAAELRKNDKNLFVKVEKVPLLVSTYLGISSEELTPIFANWIKIDTTSLDTEARKALQEKNKNSNKQIMEKIFDPLLQTKVLSAMQITDEKIDNTEAFKLHLQPNDQLLNEIGRKIAEQQTGSKTTSQVLSDSLKDVVIDTWIGKNDYLVRKFSVSFIVKPITSAPSSPGAKSTVLGLMTTPAQALGTSQTTVVLVLKLSDYGKKFAVEVPSPTISQEEFTKQIMEKSTMMGGNTVKGAQDSRRKADIQAIAKALTIYYDQAKRFPTTLTTIKALFAAGEVPVDPETKKAYFYQVGTGGQTFTLRATLSDGKFYTYTEKGIIVAPPASN